MNHMELEGFVSREKRLFGGVLETFGDGVIIRLEETGIQGYRFSNELGYAFYDVYFMPALE